MGSNGSGILTRDELLSRGLDFEEVEVPEWGGKVNVRALTAPERTEYNRASYALFTGIKAQLPSRRGDQVSLGEAELHLENVPNLDMLLVRCGTADAAGNPLFESDDDFKLVDGAPIPRLALMIREKSGIVEGAVEDAAKNSPTTPSGDSSSGSLGVSDTEASGS